MSNSIETLRHLLLVLISLAQSDVVMPFSFNIPLQSTVLAVQT